MKRRSPADDPHQEKSHLADSESGPRTAADRGPAHRSPLHEDRSQERRRRTTADAESRTDTRTGRHLAHDPRQRETAHGPQKGPEIRSRRMYRTHCPRTAGRTQKPQDARREPHPIKP